MSEVDLDDPSSSSKAYKSVVNTISELMPLNELQYGYYIKKDISYSGSLHTYDFIAQNHPFIITMLRATGSTYSNIALRKIIADDVVIFDGSILMQANDIAYYSQIFEPLRFILENLVVTKKLTVTVSSTGSSSGQFHYAFADVEI